MGLSALHRVGPGTPYFLGALMFPGFIPVTQLAMTLEKSLYSAFQNTRHVFYLGGVVCKKKKNPNSQQLIWEMLSSAATLPLY